VYAKCRDRQIRNSNDKDGDVAEIEKEGAENEEGEPQQSFPNEASGTQQIKNLKEMQS